MVTWSLSCSVFFFHTWNCSSSSLDRSRVFWWPLQLVLFDDQTLLYYLGKALLPSMTRRIMCNEMLPQKFLHDKISDLFENSATMCCEKSGWSMVDEQSSKYLSSEKCQISAFPCATSFAVSCGQFSPGEQDLWQQCVKVVNDVI